jgi:hypothetical protein
MLLCRLRDGAVPYTSVSFLLSVCARVRVGVTEREGECEREGERERGGSD